MVICNHSKYGELAHNLLLFFYGLHFRATRPVVLFCFKDKDIIMSNKVLRPDRTGSHRAQYQYNRKRILQIQDVCSICGKPVDKKLKYPHPLSPVIDHIIPVAKGGHPSDIKNLALAHNQCNNRKQDKLYSEQNLAQGKVIGNRNLPHSKDWSAYERRA